MNFAGMESSSGPKVIVDTSETYRKQSYGASAREWKNFMSSKPSQVFQVTKKRSNEIASSVEDENFGKVIKEVNTLGIKQMSWKERKAIENQKMVALGAKPSKNPRMPIALGRAIKKKREREHQAMMNEEIILGRPKQQTKKTDKHIRKDRGLLASEGIFRDGILHVKPLKHKMPEENVHKFYEGKKNKSKIFKGRK
eukprot:TRINITY_DN561_c0_g1_i10.p1 TRINITY_DN561_c0_g1~~TRINITY_DN561_c0_g1_i10.p1  ORF type:complete len:197 (+),score=47.60 TRINITY_DN561_c0_g1_i10:103-693(+)